MLAGVLLAVGAYFIYRQYAQKSAQGSGGQQDPKTGAGTGGSTPTSPAVGGVSSPVSSYQAQLEVVVKSGNLNIRKERSVNAPIVGQLAKGQKFYTELMTGGGNWYSVLTPDRKSRRGYVSSEFTKFVDSASTPSTPSGTGTKYQVTTSSGSLNIREKPDATSKIIGTLAKGTIVQGTAQPDGKWVKVTDASGKTGFVSAQYVSRK